MVDSRPFLANQIQMGRIARQNRFQFQLSKSKQIYMRAKYCHVGSTTVGVFSTMSHFVIKIIYTGKDFFLGGFVLVPRGKMKSLDNEKYILRSL